MGSEKVHISSHAVHRILIETLTKTVLVCQDSFAERLFSSTGVTQTKQGPGTAQLIPCTQCWGCPFERREQVPVNTWLKQVTFQHLVGSLCRADQVAVKQPQRSKQQKQ